MFFGRAGVPRQYSYPFISGGSFRLAMELYAGQQTKEQHEPTYCTYILPSVFVFSPIEDHESYCVTQRLGPHVR